MTIHSLASSSDLSAVISTQRPKLLYLARSFPPAIAPACVRTWNSAKYLSRLGWEVSVVTPGPSVWRQLENPEKVDAALEHEGIRRILTDHQWRCLEPDYLTGWDHGLGWVAGGICRKIARHLGVDSGFGWVGQAEEACSLLTPNDVDIILATGSPFASFNLAHRLSQRLGRPYVLDYRDPWTGNPHASRKSRPNTRREEARLLAHCAAVTIVSSSWGTYLDEQFHIGSKLHIISNGYDPDELEQIEPYDFDHFAIVYTGNFYPPKRVISPLLAALRCLKENTKITREEWYFHYYGRHGNHVHEEAIRFGVLDRVVLHGTVSRSEALSAMRGAGIVVVITSVAQEITSGDKGIVTSKIFDALGLGARILLISPPGSDIETIAENTNVARRFNADETENMAAFLKDALASQIPELKNIEEYAWTNIAKKLNVIFRTALDQA